MSDRMKIRSVILCDDIRPEMSGKEILIGVYNDSMLFAKIPAVMKPLVIRVSADILDAAVKPATMHLKDMHQTELWKGEVNISSMNKQEHVAFGFIIQGLTLYAAGTYTLELNLDNDIPQKASDFDVRLPVTDEEKKRVPTFT